MVLMLVAVNGSVIYLQFGRCMSRFPSSPLIIRVPFSYYSVLIREPKKKKAKTVLLGNLDVRTASPCRCFSPCCRNQGPGFTVWGSGCA